MPNDEPNNKQEQDEKPAGISWNDDLCPDNAGKYVTTPIGGTTVISVDDNCPQ